MKIIKQRKMLRLKINNTLIENTEYLYTVMSMYNLLEYSRSYSKASGCLWNYYRDEIDEVDDNALDSTSFQYKTKIVRETSERPPLRGNPTDVGHHYH